MNLREHTMMSDREKILVEALVFYADEYSWASRIDSDNEPSEPEIYEDSGARARKALDSAIGKLDTRQYKAPPKAKKKLYLWAYKMFSGEWVVSREFFESEALFRDMNGVISTQNVARLDHTEIEVDDDTAEVP